MPSVRRLTAILAADVAGYSRLMSADEEDTHERLKALCREVVGPKIAEHHGRIVKTTGDGMLVEFASVVDAVRCAVDVQQAMPERNLDVAADNRIEWRIGVNLGEVIVEDDDLYGDGVNIAARIEALADAGGLFVSNPVHDHVRDRLSLVFEDLGEQQVKNLRCRSGSTGFAASVLPPVAHRHWPSGAAAARQAVERGEEIVITRRGKPVAKLVVPAGPDFDRTKARRAVAGLLEASRGVTLGSLRIKDLISEGRS